MSFETPAALWGLTSLVLLVLFSLWRQSAQKTVVPSLLLWKKIPERNPPIRALRRPQWRLELLLQALAIAAAVGALAGPYRSTDRPKPRKVALVFDTSARMQAGGRIEAAKAEARRLVGGPLAGDDVRFFAANPAPQRLSSIDEVRGVDAHVDLAPLVQAARASSDHVIVLGDRPVEGVHTVLFAGPAANAGIVDFTVTDDEVFVGIVNHGPPQPATVRLEWGSQKVEEAIPALPARRGWFRKGDFSKADEVRVTLDPGDGYPLDDSVRASRLGASRIPVVVGGTGMPLLERALGSIPGVVVSHQGSGGLLSVGVDARPAPAAFAVWLHSPEGRWEPKAWVVHPHALTSGLREGELGRWGVGELPADARPGEPLLEADGKRVAVVREGVLHVAIELDPRGWPSTPSFPIFWKNVVDFASKGGSAWTVVRTGVPQAMPAEASEVATSPSGALFSLSPSGRFLAFTRGLYGFRTPSGVRSVEAGLLDERESDTAGVTRPLDWNAAAPADREYARQGLAGWAAGLCLALLAAAWVLGRRSD